MSDARPVEGQDVVLRVERLVALAARRWELLEAASSGSGPDEARGPAQAPGPRERARELLEHTRSYLLPRARDLDAPLLVVLLGPTGSGKSSLINTVAGAVVSRPGVLRPTTRHAVIVATASDAASLLERGPLAAIPRGRLELRPEGAHPGIVVVDAPDIDSVEHDNRALADTLLEIADLCVFVTTATRYADRVPWDVLRRIEQRGLPLIVVVNRLPDGPDAVAVLDDVRRLLGATRLQGPPGSSEAGDATNGEPGPGAGSDAGAEPGPGAEPHAGAGSDAGTTAAAGAAASRPGPGAGSDAGGGAAAGADRRVAGLEIVGVPEGALAPGGQALEAASITPLLERIEALAGDRLARRALAARSLAGAVAGLAPLSEAVASDLEGDAAVADELRRVSATAHAEETVRLLARLGSGPVLREEVVRQWHSYVGADQLTRFFSGGIGRLRGNLVALLRGTPEAPIAAVQRGAADDLAVLVVAAASDAAHHTAMRWSADPRGAGAIESDPSLWTAAPDLAARTRAAVDDWTRAIAADVAVIGADKKGVARVAALSVNALAVTVMLLTFAHTGGVTGAEVGVAAATAFLSQKLLNAIFGEAAVQEMIDRARERLHDAISGLMAGQGARFAALIEDGAGSRALATELRALVRSGTDRPAPAIRGRD